MIKTTRRQTLARLRPPPRTRLSKWLEANLRLSDTTALPGPIKLYEFQKGIADAMSDPLIPRVTVQKSARVGFTSLLVGLIGSHVINDPAPMLIVRPTEDDCKTFVTADLEPTFAASPAIAIEWSSSNKKQPMLARRFPGGSMRVVAAKSPRNLANHTARVLLLDETDRMDVTESEGDPIALAIIRTQTFPDRKIIMGSTPTLAETSPVLKAYEASDQRVFEVPCPHCGDFHVIKWENIEWDEGKPETACWGCPGCGAMVDEHHKNAMVAAGRWRITKPEVKDHAGFKINSLVSPLANCKWGLLAAEYLAAKQDTAELQVFYNTLLGEAWKHAGDEIDDSAMAGRVEDFGLNRLPEDVLSITAGVDVQHNRLEATLLGWSAEGVMYALGHQVIPGDWSSDAVWDDLDDLLRTKWRHPLGGELGVDAAAVDCGDGLTMRKALDFTGPRWSRRIIAIKGQGDQQKDWLLKSSQRSQGTPFWNVGTHPIKRHIFARVKDKAAFRFSDDLDEAWFEQLAGERVMIRKVRGRDKADFVPVKSRRHEVLDCMVYAIAVSRLIKINFMERAEQLRRPDVKPPKKSRVTPPKRLEHSSQF